MVAVLAAVAVVVTGVQFVERWTPEPGDGVKAAVAASTPELTGADVVARHATATFANSQVGTDPALSPAQRGADLPSDPVTGLTRQTVAGPVQIVLPGGLGPAQTTRSGQMIYPDRGAGFDFLAENTTSGTRTVARIPDASGPRAVTTFVRTPAQTVMLARTNGYVTINEATPAADTVAVFSPAETRDATGALVPASYVVRQLRPGLYQMTEVIDPTPGTVWPVFVDPPLHLGSGLGGVPLPAGFLDSLSSAADTVGAAVSTAASATVTGAKAVGVFVKENPLESAMLVGGVALAVTGVGGPAGAAAIAAVTVNLSSAGLDVAAAAMPDNQLLGEVATYVGAVSMITPQGAAKKAVTEGLEAVAEQALKNTDAVIDVAKAAPTPPATLANQIATAPGKVDVPGVGTPKAPNAPPAGGTIPSGHGPDGPRSLPAGCILDCGHQTPTPAGVYSQTEVPGHYNANLDSIQGGQPGALDRVLSKADRDANRRAATGHLPPAGEGSVKHEYPHASAQQGGTGADVYKLPKRESDVEMRIMGNLYQRQGVKYGDAYTTAYRGDDGVTRCASCAIDRRSNGITPRGQGSADRQSDAPRSSRDAGPHNTSGNGRRDRSDRKASNSNPKKKKKAEKKKKKKNNNQAQKRRKKQRQS